MYGLTGGVGDLPGSPAGALRPRLDSRRFTLDTVMDAHALVAGAAGAGKVVVDVVG